MAIIDNEGNKITWFKIMWNNWFIQLSAVCLMLCLYVVYIYGDFEYEGDFVIAIAIPLAALFAIIMGGISMWIRLKRIYKKWN